MMLHVVVEISGLHRIRICSEGKHPGLNSLHVPRELSDVRTARSSTAIAVDGWQSLVFTADMQGLDDCPDFRGLDVDVRK